MKTLRLWLAASVRDIAAVAAWLAIIAGVWGLSGWPCAAIAAGVPVLGLYLFGEIKGGA